MNGDNGAYKWVQAFRLEMTTTDAGQAMVITPYAKPAPDFMCMSIDEAIHALRHGKPALVGCGDDVPVALALGVEVQRVEVAV